MLVIAKYTESIGLLSIFAPLITNDARTYVVYVVYCYLLYLLIDKEQKDFEI